MHSVNMLNQQQLTCNRILCLNLQYICTTQVFTWLCNICRIRGTYNLLSDVALKVIQVVLLMNCVNTLLQS